MRRCQTCGRLHEDATETCPRDGTKLQDYKPTLAPGQKVAGGVTIVGAIGVGPSGEVYEGRDAAKDERVVVRLLAEDVAKDKRLSDVVRRHLLKQQEFNHKYVVRTRAVDQHEGRILFIRDWVDGTRLEDLLTAEGALSVRRALALGIRICTALAEAHKVGLLHLQLRASNVFVVPDQDGDGDSVRLVDFGVGPRRKVGPRPYYGEPATLSPEQVEGKIVSFKSDMFAAGLLLYRMLAGQPAFVGADDVVVKQICEAPVPPVKYRAGDPIPMELWTFVRQALEKKPIHRPIGMAQMAERLKELAGDAAAGRLSIDPPSPSDAAAVETPAPAPARVLSPPLDRMAIGRIALKKRGPEGAEPASADAAGIDVDVAVDEPPVVAAPADVEPASAPGPEQPTARPVKAGGPADGEQVVPAETPARDEPAAEQPPKAVPVPPAEPPSTAKAEDKPSAKSPAKPSPAEKGAAPKEAAKPPPKSPPKPPKSGASAAAEKSAREDVKPSSSTMPMEPEMIEEARARPALKGPQVPPRRPAGDTEELLAARFRRGLLIGLGLGLVLALVVFLVMRSSGGRGGQATAGPPCEPEVVATAADAGTTESAEPPVEPPPVKDEPDVAPPVAEAAGSATPADASSSALDAEPAAPEAQPPVPADAGRLATETTAGAADAGRPPADRAASAEAGPPPAGDTGRPVEVRADAGRPETGGSSGGVSPEDLAQANELVAQGDTALAARDFGGARSAYEQALRLHPQNNRAKIGLGRTAFQQGNFEDAVRYLEPIYRNQGNMDLGMAYVRVGRLGDAKRQFEKLLERNPNNSDAQRALEAVQRQLGE
jgi:serine/threonine-protein kinase